MYILLRKAHIKDCEKVFELSNDSLVRQMSFNLEKINFDEHVHWFVKKLYDKDFLLLLAFTEDNNFIGQIKFKLRGTFATIGISITKEFRGKDLGKKLIRLAHEYLQKVNNKINFINAYIKEKNKASIKLFKSLGYIKVKNIVIEDINFTEYYYNLNKEK
jgi:spore coat polysaccharide biosynthesis protein SpsF